MDGRQLQRYRLTIVADRRASRPLLAGQNFSNVSIVEVHFAEWHKGFLLRNIRIWANLNAHRDGEQRLRQSHLEPLLTAPTGRAV